MNAYILKFAKNSLIHFLRSTNIKRRKACVILAETDVMIDDCAHK